MDTQSKVVGTAGALTVAPLFLTASAMFGQKRTKV